MRRVRASQRVVAGALGGLFLAGGVLAVFLTDNAPGSASLLALGALVIGVAVFSDRIESLEFAGAKLQLRDLARQRFALAAERESDGDLAGAAAVRRQAHAFQRLAGAYERLRRTRSPGPERTEVLDDLVAQACQLGEETRFEPLDVWAWFDEGADEARVIALGLMQGDPELRDFFGVLDAIESPRSPFEQYHALCVAQLMLAGLSPLERRWLAEEVARAREGKRFQEDPPLMTVSRSILDELGGASASP